jgi:hypothetical protein
MREAREVNTGHQGTPQNVRSACLLQNLTDATETIPQVQA